MTIFLEMVGISLSINLLITATCIRYYSKKFAEQKIEEELDVEDLIPFDADITANRGKPWKH